MSRAPLRTPISTSWPTPSDRASMERRVCRRMPLLDVLQGRKLAPRRRGSARSRSASGRWSRRRRTRRPRRSRSAVTRGARHLDHGARPGTRPPRRLAPAPPRPRGGRLGLAAQLLDVADERDHDLRLDGDRPSRATCTAASKIARACISRDLRVGDAEPAAAVAEHGVELVQLLHRPQHLREARDLRLVGRMRPSPAGPRPAPSAPRAWAGTRGAAGRGCGW